MPRGRPARPWYRESRDAWYVIIKGRHVRLASGLGGGPEAEAEAWSELRRLRQAAGRTGPVPHGFTFRELINSFLESVEAAVGRGERAPVTLEGYVRRLGPAGAAIGSTPAAEVTPYHVHRWLDSTGWGPTTRHGAIVACKRATRWATRSGLLGADPLATLDRGRPRRRTEFPDGMLLRAVLHALDEEADPLATLIRGLYLTGFRIGELVGIRARDLDAAARRVEVSDKGARDPGGRRAWRHLSGAAVASLAALAGGRGLDEHLFTNRRGRPWTRNAANQAFIKYRKATGIGPELTPHAIRHRFGCDALRALGDASTVAALMGHRSVRMVNEVYGHWDRQGALLSEAADRVRPR